MAESDVSIADRRPFSFGRISMLHDPNNFIGELERRREEESESDAEHHHDDGPDPTLDRFAAFLCGVAEQPVHPPAENGQQD